MRCVSVSLVMLLALAACGGEQATADIVGRWSVDATRMREDFVRIIDAKIAAVSEEDAAVFQKRKEERLAELEAFRMTLEIAADETYTGQLVTDGKTHTTKGNWKRLQSGGWRFSSTHEDDKQLPKPRTLDFRLEGSQLVGGQVPEHTFRFDRD